MSSQSDEYCADSWLSDQISGVGTDLDEIIECLEPSCADGPDDEDQLHDMARQLNDIRKKLYAASRAIERRLHNEPDDLRFCPCCGSSVSHAAPKARVGYIETPPPPAAPAVVESSRGKETFTTFMCFPCSDKHANQDPPLMKRRRTE